jgi:hypothetical protein
MIAAGKTKKWRPATAEIAVLAAFAISRILYYWAGIRFDAARVVENWQYIDPTLMQHRLFESLYYLHMQPPGFNLAIGLVVKLFPNSYGTVLQICYIAMGVAIALALLRLLRLLRVNEWAAAVLTILFTVNPGCVLYENLAIYEYPILLLLLAAAITLFRLVQEPSVMRSIGFYACICGLVMIRNQFHLVYVVLITIVLLAVMGNARKAVLAGSLPVIALILALYVKNWILFGAFTASTWAGMNTGVITTFQLTPEEADRLVKSGIVTPLAKIPPFSGLNLYAGIVELAPKTGIPVLDEEGTQFHPNFNNPTYLKLADLYVANSKAILRHYPQAYLRSVVIAWFTYFLPTSDMHSFDIQRRNIHTFDRVFNTVFFGQFRTVDDRRQLRVIKASGKGFTLPLYTGTFLIVILPALMLWAVAQLGVRRLRERLTTEEAVVLGFMVFTILFVTAVSNLLSSFENNRYRFIVDGYYTALAGMAITAILARWRGWKAQE